MDLAGFGIRDPHGLPGIVDKELFSGPVFLTEAGVKLFGPLTVDAAELAVLISLRVLLLVFMPQKLKGHTLGSLSRRVAGMRRNMQLASLALDRGIIIMSQSINCRYSKMIVRSKRRNTRGREGS
jgi:hypothetical protein